jgi:hypothetical protein
MAPIKFLMDNKRGDPMYLNAHCPHCGGRIKKISLFVIKPGIIKCPGCKKLSQVTGLLPGTAVYVVAFSAFGMLMGHFKSEINDRWVIFTILGGLWIAAIYLMSLFLGLEK